MEGTHRSCTGEGSGSVAPICAVAPIAHCGECPTSKRRTSVHLVHYAHGIRAPTLHADHRPITCRGGPSARRHLIHTVGCTTCIYVPQHFHI